jgi:hypothetical protein
MSMCAIASAKPVTDTSPAFRSSIVDQGNGTYLYMYSVDPWKLAKQDLSNFSVFWCGSTSASDFESSIKFTLELTDEYVKFDSLESDNNDTTITFSFESANVPTDGVVTYKAGRTTWESAAQVPSCNVIPETSSTSLIGGTAILFLLRRRR